MLFDNNFGNNVTTIIITHRVTSIKNCDNIYIIDKGEIKGEGTFDKLEKENSLFNNRIKTS